MDERIAGAISHLQSHGEAPSPYAVHKTLQQTGHRDVSYEDVYTALQAQAPEAGQAEAGGGREGTVRRDVHAASHEAVPRDAPQDLPGSQAVSASDEAHAPAPETPSEDEPVDLVADDVPPTQDVPPEADVPPDDALDLVAQAEHARQRAALALADAEQAMAEAKRVGIRAAAFAVAVKQAHYVGLLSATDPELQEAQQQIRQAHAALRQARADVEQAQQRVEVAEVQLRSAPQRQAAAERAQWLLAHHPALVERRATALAALRALRPHDYHEAGDYWRQRGQRQAALDAVEQEITEALHQMHAGV